MRLGFLRYVLVAFVSAVAAIATVGTAVYAHNDGFNERIVACFDSRDPNSDACRSALEVSPVGADFYTQLAANVTNAPAPEPKPQPKPTNELYSLMKACLQTKDLASDECQQALEASGLSEADFKAKLAAKFGTCVTAMNHDGENPCTKHVEKPTEKPVDKTVEKPAGTSASTTECLKLRETMRAGLTANELRSKAEHLYALCAKARAESQMDGGEFWTTHR
jgi:hypothetical protein